MPSIRWWSITCALIVINGFIVAVIIGGPSDNEITTIFSVLGVVITLVATVNQWQTAGPDDENRGDDGDPENGRHRFPAQRAGIAVTVIASLATATLLVLYVIRSDGRPADATPRHDASSPSGGPSSPPPSTPTGSGTPSAARKSQAPPGPPTRRPDPPQGTASPRPRVTPPPPKPAAIFCQGHASIDYRGRDLDFCPARWGTEELVYEEDQGLYAKKINAWRRVNSSGTPTKQECETALNDGSARSSGTMATKRGDAFCLITSSGDASTDRTGFVRVTDVSSAQAGVSYLIWR